MTACDLLIAARMAFSSEPRANIAFPIADVSSSGASTIVGNGPPRADYSRPYDSHKISFGG
jgi:hypothetical protein